MANQQMKRHHPALKQPGFINSYTERLEGLRKFRIGYAEFQKVWG